MKHEAPCWSVLLDQDMPHSQPLKEEQGVGVYALTHQNNKGVLKIYPCRTARERLKAWVCWDRAHSNARHARVLIKAQLLPSFVPYTHQTLWKGQWCNMLWVPWLAGESALSLLGVNSTDRSSDHEHAQKIATLLVALAQKGLYYRDWNFSNLLLAPHQAWVVDWDQLKQVPVCAQRYIYQKMKARVLHNWTEEHYLHPNTQKVFEAWFTHHERHGIVASM